MHIVFVTHGSFDSHATLKRATGMATPLLEAKQQVTILMQDSEANREKVMLECPEASICWYSSGLSSFKERAYKQKLLDKLQPDLVWICAVGLRNWMVRPRRGCIMLADHSELFSYVGKNHFRRIFYWLVEWGHVFNFDFQICASRYLEREYSKKLKKIRRRQNPFYFPYAFNRKTLESDTHPLLESLKKKYAEQKLIVYLGTFSENYGILDIIKAAAALKKLRSDFKFILIGKGKEKGRALTMVKDLKIQDQVEFPGYVPESEISSYFAAASVFLCPLRDTVQDWARCPSKLFLFLPYKKPIVSCRIGEAAELLGESGFYYTPSDVVSMTQALNLAIDANPQSDFPNPREHDWEARVATFEAWLDAQKK